MQAALDAGPLIHLAEVGADIPHVKTPNDYFSTT